MRGFYDSMKIDTFEDDVLKSLSPNSKYLEGPN
jgi:hypothetical protein